MGIVPPWEVSRIQKWAPEAKPYDLLYNSACDNQTDDERMMLIYRFTHKDDDQ